MGLQRGFTAASTSVDIGTRPGTRSCRGFIKKSREVGDLPDDPGLLGKTMDSQREIDYVTFNLGVVGSSPTGLTNNPLKYLTEIANTPPTI